MPAMRRSLFVMFLAMGAVPFAHAQVAYGEASRTPAKAAPTWRAADFPATQVARIDYRELPVERLLDIQKRNASPDRKAIQIGTARALATEGRTTAAAPLLQWRKLGTGAVSRLQVTSPDALALRVGLQVKQLHPDVELRFAGSDAPQKVVAVVRAGQAQLLADAEGIYWTPSTDGATQTIEIYRPSNVVAGLARVSGPKVSHLLANSQNDFKIIEKIGESGTCNVDTACRVNELGANFTRAIKSVAHMQFVSTVNGQTGTYICTGTLLADTVAATQIPYFYSAHHCISTQAEASTLNTFWRYEATACGSGVSTPVTQLSGGATYLHSEATTDALLMRLNDAAPAGAEFSGWDSTAIANNTAVLAIHHPRGDAKKVSSGQQIPASTDANEYGVGWLSGTTEGGSSGSGLFTLSPNGYLLRGGLHGGYAACSNTGNLNNTQNRDWYSRFDVVYPRLSAWLSPTPVGPQRVNGSQPLIPGQANVVTGNAIPAASAPAPRAVPARAAIKTRGALER